MTFKICEVSQMTNTIIHSNDELLEEITKLNICPGKLKVFLQYHNQLLLNELISRTSFLDKTKPSKNVPMTARLYCIEHNLTERPICQNPNCKTHNTVDWCPDTKSFRKYCSLKCAATCEKTISTRTNTMMTKYNAKHAL